MKSAHPVCVSTYTTQIATFRKPEQYTKALLCAAADAAKYNFHTKAIVGNAILYTTRGIASFPLIAFDEKGWALCSTYGNTTGFIEIDYVFVKPQYRRHGWLRHFIQDILAPINGGEGILVGCNVQRSPELFSALCSMGFKLWQDRKVSTNGKELLLLWRAATTLPRSDLFNDLTTLQDSSDRLIYYK